MPYYLDEDQKLCVDLSETPTEEIKEFFTDLTQVCYLLLMKGQQIEIKIVTKEDLCE